jgi:AcrR family transcriptional regulator
VNQPALATPVQPRAKRTYEVLLKAAQEILVENGYDALNSNAVAERAGLTPPSFYRYFKDKHMLLKVLAQRLLDAQDELAETELLRITPTFEGAVDAVERLLTVDIELTRSFTAARELLVLMRALPELREVRLATHERSARLLAEATREFYPQLSHAALETRVRLATELYFSTLEMLFETEFRNRPEIVRRAAIAIQAAISMPGE